MFKTAIFAAVSAVALMSGAASATVFNGDTTGAPTWNRPLAGVPPVSLSGVGTATPYKVDTFTVTASGNYLFTDTPLTAGFDNFIVVYANAFNPAAPFTNILGSDDDGVGGVGSPTDLTLSLNTGITYYAVTTGFNNADFGLYSLNITGPGTVVAGGAVPEPATWAMMIAGLGAVGFSMRRQRSAKVSFA